MKSVIQWFRRYYLRIINSIAFFPAIIALCFLLLVIIMMEMDLRGWGNALNEQFKWLRLKDADTARTIVGTVAGGVISLMVFNFSMFMIVLNQAASQMSNRMLENMIGDRFQKLILGFYVGTIVYALFLLININNDGDVSYIPSFSIYLLLVFTILDIFLFIYFLHYITQSFRYEQLIERIHSKTIKAINESAGKQIQNTKAVVVKNAFQISSPESGYFQTYSKEQLLALTKKHDFAIRFLHPRGYFILKGTPMLEISNTEKCDPAIQKKLFLAIDFFHGQPITINSYYGFQHLMEVGIKALSPSLNDPVTAILSLHALTNLFAMKLACKNAIVITDEEGWPRIIEPERSISSLFESSILPIWHYGKKDAHVQNAMLQLIKQLNHVDKEKVLYPLLQQLEQDVETEMNQ